MHDREPKKDREIEWINERRRVRRKRARINERTDRKMKMGNLERKGKRRMKGEARNNLETERRARKQRKEGAVEVEHGQSRRQRVMKGDVSERERGQVARAIGGIRERERERRIQRGRERGGGGERGKKIGSPTRTEIGSKP